MLEKHMQCVTTRFRVQNSLNKYSLLWTWLEIFLLKSKSNHTPHHFDVNNIQFYLCIV